MSEEIVKQKRPYRRKAVVEAQAEIEIPAAAPAPTPEPAPAPPTPPAPKPPPQLTQAELFGMKMAQLESEKVVAELDAVKWRKAYILALLDPKGRIAAEEKKHAELADKLKKSKERFEIIKIRAGQRLGIDLNKCDGFDADTGQVFPKSA